MRRFLALLCALSLAAVPVAAQGQTPQETPDEDGDAGPPTDKQPSLPQQASDTAKQVVDTVFTFTGETFDSIGAALQNILGGGAQGSDGSNG